MFGSSTNGFAGMEGFAGTLLSSPHDLAFFMFQAMFVGTAATIVAGAVAERMKFNAYLIISVIISLLIYPVSGHCIPAKPLVLLPNIRAKPINQKTITATVKSAMFFGTS